MRMNKNHNTDNTKRWWEWEVEELSSLLMGLQMLPTAMENFLVVS